MPFHLIRVMLFHLIRVIPFHLIRAMLFHLIRVMLFHLIRVMLFHLIRVMLFHLIRMMLFHLIRLISFYLIRMTFFTWLEWCFFTSGFTIPEFGLSFPNSTVFIGIHIKFYMHFNLLEWGVKGRHPRCPHYAERWESLRPCLRKDKLLKYANEGVGTSLIDKMSEYVYSGDTFTFNE